ncbi:hypothetical protein BpHYR1_000237 [Brachionus plicatilis]|uniref:Uncharacterized protein n=1 Tax=Brachionus plicatilis TaxID=10195 RepID=A0A3M7PEL0_BRAPC|nr:hypothetical protein BpHYR1_000237 [Brachionus plicatilis]
MYKIIGLKNPRKNFVKFKYNLKPILANVVKENQVVVKGERSVAPSTPRVYRSKLTGSKVFQTLLFSSFTFLFNNRHDPNLSYQNIVHVLNDMRNDMNRGFEKLNHCEEYEKSNLIISINFTRIRANLDDNVFLIEQKH